MRVIDSHTGGEPTRVVLDGGPDLGSGPLAERARRLAQDHMAFCHAMLREPRGQVAMVGALLVEPVDPRCLTGVIFFDAAAVLEMCGHGTIGLAVTLAHLGMATKGTHLIETPAGVIEVLLQDDNTVSVTNIESHVIQSDVTVELADLGQLTGTIAYGGNWFYIVEPCPVPVIPENIATLTRAGVAIRSQLNATAQGAKVDHVIFQGQPLNANNFSRNFVLCPDDTYDRSPCGTGSSALLACLAHQNRLQPDQQITQESIIGSTYRLSYQQGPNGGVVPTIAGEAYVLADTTMIFSANDPFADGIAA
ncbi:proline racemase family protein [Tateyamaria sp.]|uniref:4-hydroxyproline epimerase n=1 Tax=Tateyamaria sp. TaxID=1929288 RepID=UPI00329AC723